MATTGLVGIIANPASGKDIRRLVAHATTVDNQGKVSIVRRALVGLAVLGVREVWAMPDGQGLVQRAQEGLAYLGSAAPVVHLLEMPVTGKAEDSERAARRLREMGAGCIISLGGDGTARVISKESGEVPLLPISTGTNNVLPSFVEGTIAGMAAAAVAQQRVALHDVAIRHKWLELAINGTAVDRALVDVAVIAGQFLGARAIWSVGDLRQVMVTRGSPASIGISAIVGAARPLEVEEPVAIALTLAEGSPQRVLAAIGPGLVSEVGIQALQVVGPGEPIAVVPERPLILALDGEREALLHPGDSASLTMRLDGPWLVDATRAMYAMAAAGVLRRGQTS